MTRNLNYQTTMDHETKHRHALALRIAEQFGSRFTTRAVLLIGSTARGRADRYSDIDMSILYESLPGGDEIEEAWRSLRCEEWRMLSEASDEGFVDTGMIEGIEYQISHSPLLSFEKILDDVLINNDTDHDKHVILGGVAESVPLHGAPLAESWKRKIAEYPAALAEAMVRAHLDFRPLWFLHRRVAGRDTFIVFQELMIRLTRNLLGVHLGVNRLYPEHDFKRLATLIERMEVSPVDFNRRIRLLMQGEYDVAVREAGMLIEETFAIVERCMPAVETEEAKRKFRRPEPVVMPGS